MVRVQEAALSCPGPAASRCSPPRPAWPAAQGSPAPHLASAGQSLEALGALLWWRKMVLKTEEEEGESGPTRVSGVGVKSLLIWAGDTG